RRALLFDEQDVHFPFVGYRTVFDATRDDEQLARPECHRSVSELDGQSTVEHEKKVIRFIVLVPYEGPFDLRHHEVMPVEPADGARSKVLGKRGELCREIDCLLHRVNGWSRAELARHALA